MTTPNLYRFPAKRRKAIRWIVGVLLFYTALGFFILPPIIRAVAVKKLAQQLNREVSIGKVKLNPFTLSTTIRGLLIKDKDGQPFVSWDEVYVNFQILSFFGHPWVFKEISTTKPFVRVQMNKDRSLNFSDLLAKNATNAPHPNSKPFALRIRRLHIAGATASLTDLTPRTPFHRVLGPMDVTLVNFHTDPDSKNPYSFSGTTDAGEKFAWSGCFYLDPLRSQGDLSLENLTLNKYAPLYQDLVRFQIRDGIVDIHSAYRFDLSTTNHAGSVTNASFALHSFKLAEPGTDANVVELPEFAVTGASIDVNARRAEVASITASGATLTLRRNKGNEVNVLELSKPAETATNASGGILLLLQSVTNAVAMLLNSTNTWAGTIHDVNFTNCALSLEDLANSRPALLNLDSITLAAKNISNIPGTNLTASLSLRWNTNGTIKTDVAASFTPPTADIRVALDNIELRPIDPYLEPKLNVFIIGSKLGMDGHIRLRTTDGALPEVTFTGNARLDDFSTVDGVLGEDLLKWGSVRLSGVKANLNPPGVAIKEIAVDDVYARLIIETNHTINLQAALRQDNTNAPAAELVVHSPVPTVAARPGPPEAGTANLQPAASLPNISIASVVISNAQVRFSDRSVTPNVNLAIQQAGGTINGLSSEELRHADVKLHAKVDNIGPVEITGTINPFSGRYTNDLKIAVKDVDLTPTSPYSGKFAGYRIAKGKLAVDLAYHLYGRNLKSENVITLDQFTFGDKVDSPDATKLPVRLAVAILKDRNGKIELDVPIEGSLDDPQFKLNKVIVRAIVNILTKIATSPFSVLGAVFGGRGEEISYQDFAPGSYDLPPPGRDKLDALVKGLYERPALQLEIEGSVDPVADRDGLRRVALEKRLRTEKWQSLRKSARAATTPEQVSLEPDERAALLKQFFTEALSKGQLVLPTTNAAPVQASSTGEDNKRAASARPASRQTRAMEKGGLRLMENSEVAATIAHAASDNPKAAGVADDLEMALLNSISIGDGDFAALASDRAKAVRAYILQSGKVEAERLFLTENQSRGTKTQGSRVYLQLR